MKVTDKYVFFWGKNDIYSNFYKKPFFYRGEAISCSEVGFMVEKAYQFGDKAIAEILFRIKDPDKAKALGRKIRNYDDDIWNEVRFERMKDVLRVKFKDPMLRKQLVMTGSRTLVEASPYDTIWGIGMESSHIDAMDETKWRGANLLGKALMDIRAEITK